MAKVRLGCKYRFEPNILDCSSPAMRYVKIGDTVRVTRAKSIGQKSTVIGGTFCYIETLDGQFAGMVCVNSLVSLSPDRHDAILSTIDDSWAD